MVVPKRLLKPLATVHNGDPTKIFGIGGLSHAVVFLDITVVINSSEAKPVTNLSVD